MSALSRLPLRFLFNFFAYEAVWFAAVYGAGQEQWWYGAVAAAIFAALHFPIAGEGRVGRMHDLRLVGIAVALGVVLDGSLAATALVDYHGDAVALPPGGAPLWILTMWAAFALTLRHSLGVLARKPLLALVVGAVFGPLAYISAERGFDAATLGDPRWLALAALAVGWGVAMWLLATLAGRWAPQPFSSEGARAGSPA